MRICIVDDEPVNLKVLRAQLEAAGHQVESAADGLEALSRLRAETFDAVISDILMPRMDGYGLCREVRADPRLRELPFIFYTATFTAPADRKLGLDLGGDLYLHKPAAARELLDGLDSVRARGQRPVAAMAPDAAVLREYNTRLVNKLAETNAELQRSLAAMQTAVGQVRALFESAPDGIFVIGTDHRCTDANQRFAEMMGYARDELIGMDVPRFAAAPHGDRVIGEVARLLAGEDYQKRWPIQRRDGGVLHVEVSAAPMPGGEVIVIVRDISQRLVAERALQDSEKHYRDLFDQATEGIFVANAGGYYVDVNPAGCALTGYSRDELLRMHIGELVSREEVARVGPEIALVGRGERVEGQWRLRRKDGRIVLAEVSSRPLEDGKIQAFVRDVTARRVADDARRKRAEELERFHEISVGRELQMVELKREINQLARRLGEPERYDLSFLTRA